MAALLLRSFPNGSPITTGSYAPKASWHKRKFQKEYNLLRFSQSSLNHHYQNIEGGYTYKECNRNYMVKATSGQSFESKPEAFGVESKLDSIKYSLDVFYRFSRPYTFITMALATISPFILAVEKLSDISPLLFTGLSQIMVASMLIHVYIVGVNQLFDVEIDKINKPYLPLASGELSFEIGVIITVSFLILAFCFSWTVGSWPLFCTLLSHFVLSSGYSMNVPLLGWKRSAINATISICLQGVCSQVGYFIHMQNHMFKRPIAFPRSQIFAIAFLGLLYIVIAQLKDLPDIEGDRKHGVKNLSILIGSKPVFWTCVSLLEIAYGVAIMVGISSPYLWSKIITGVGHAILALILWYHAKSVDLKSNASTYSFYMLIWKLVSAEYFLIPFVR